MVAFVTSSLIGLLGVGLVVWYSRRRPQGQPVSWGEAMAASFAVFFLITWWYAVIPHQWLTWADNELRWRSDTVLLGPGDIFEPNRFIPFTITKQVVRDIVVVLIYVAGLLGQIALWAVWQGRGKIKEPVARSTYGRPLVRRG